MTYWLMKSEPDEFSIDDLRLKKEARWDGVRNYQARNFIRQMAIGDHIWFYHSSCKKVGIAGIMKVVGTHYPDPLALDETSPYYDEKSLEDNKWSAIDVAFERKFESTYLLSDIKRLAETDQRLTDFALTKKGNRLSVMPVSEAQWECVMAEIESR